MIGKLFTRKFLKLKLKHSIERSRLNNGKAEKLLNYLSTNSFSSDGSGHSDKSEGSAVRIRQRPQTKVEYNSSVRLFLYRQIRLAQLVQSIPTSRKGRRFESVNAHKQKSNTIQVFDFFYSNTLTTHVYLLHTILGIS